MVDVEVPVLVSDEVPVDVALVVCVVVGPSVVVRVEVGVLEV